MKIIMAENLLRANSTTASKNRALLDSHGIKVINLIGSAGAGKTALLEKTIQNIGGQLKIGVIEGDISTDRDACRIAQTGAFVIQINTGGICHLNAAMVSRALEELHLPELNLLFIENVGNLVCPSSFDLGEDKKIVVFSTAEGSDKPAKYPVTFLNAQATVITKADLIPFTNFNLSKCVAEIKNINPLMDVFVTSAYSGEGMEDWLKWLQTYTISGRKGA